MFIGLPVQFTQKRAFGRTIIKILKPLPSGSIKVHLYCSISLRPDRRTRVRLKNTSQRQLRQKLYPEFVGNWSLSIICNECISKRKFLDIGQLRCSWTVEQIVVWRPISIVIFYTKPNSISGHEMLHGRRPQYLRNKLGEPVAQLPQC